MRRCNPVTLLVVTAAAFAALAGNASAEIGKKVSVTTGTTALIPSYPTFASTLAVQVPETYRSRSNFLIVKASYRASCSGGDFMGSVVDVAGYQLTDAGIPFETLDEDAPGQIVSKVYYLLPENLGGPQVPPDSTVTLKVTSQFGSGCSATNGTMTVKAAK
jgi:hypothetical protein